MLQIESQNSSLDMSSKESARLRSQLPHVNIKGGEDSYGSRINMVDENNADIAEIFKRIKEIPNQSPIRENRRSSLEKSQNNIFLPPTQGNLYSSFKKKKEPKK